MLSRIINRSVLHISNKYSILVNTRNAIRTVPLYTHYVKSTRHIGTLAFVMSGTYLALISSMYMIWKGNKIISQHKKTTFFHWIFNGDTTYDNMITLLNGHTLLVSVIDYNNPLTIEKNISYYKTYVDEIFLEMMYKQYGKTNELGNVIVGIVDICEGYKYLVNGNNVFVPHGCKITFVKISELLQNPYYAKIATKINSK